MMRKTWTVIFIIILFLYNNVSAKAVNNKTINLNTRYAVLMDVDSGRILYEKDSYRVVPMASTTKIMTALVALENSNPKDVVTVSKNASSIRGSTIGLKSGQKLTMEELLYGLMLRSGNDCAIAIAEYISGSVDKFAELMNTKAFQIGAFNTHFTTPHGLDKDAHFTTAYDLALITRFAFNNNEFNRIVSTKDINIEGYSGTRSFHNINKLLYSLDGADGVKTGYTGKAGKCLVSSASKNGRRIICVVLDSNNRWNDSKKLLEFGFNTYNKDYYIGEEYQSKTLLMNGDYKNKINACLYDIPRIPLSDEEMKEASIKTEFLTDIKAPVYKGQQLGKLSLYMNDKCIYTIPYRAADDIYSK